jgi:hypothetical protein
MLQFAPATKEKSKARIALIGPSGSGKTYTALSLAAGLGANIGLIDTENGSASKYADDFKFSTLSLTEFSPATYVEAIKAAEQAGFDVLIIDSLSHAWMGRGGALEMVDREAAKSTSGNSFAAWRKVTPEHNHLVEALVQCSIHLIVTMRSKTEYVLQANDRGKIEPKKVGMAPVQRDGLEYEFDITADLDLDHNFMVSKTRCRLLDGAVVNKAGFETAQTIKAWLSDGVEPTPRPVHHWSDNEKARNSLATNVAKLGATMEDFFTVHKLADWSEFRRYEGEAADAWAFFKERWQKNGATQPT